MKLIWLTLQSIIAVSIQIPFLALDTSDIEPTLVNKTTLARLKSIVPFAQASYCSKVASWNCTPCTVPDTQVITTVGDYLFDSFGYVAVNKRLGLIVASFRGSQNLRNWIRDLQFAVLIHNADAECSLP